jgi:hypothetical protein
MDDFRTWMTLCEADIDDFDDFDDKSIEPQAPKQHIPYQFMRLLNKHKARQQDRLKWRRKQQQRYNDETEAADGHEFMQLRGRHLPKSQINYKPLRTPFIRFGKFRKSSQIFLDPEMRAEMGNVTHEVGVSCFEAYAWKDGFIVMEPHTDRATYQINDPFGLIFHNFQRSLIAYLDHQQPMDIFLIYGHLASFGKNQEMVSLGSDGEFLLDMTKPYTSSLIAPEHIYMDDRTNRNLIQWFDVCYRGGISKMREDIAQEDEEVSESAK